MNFLTSQGDAIGSALDGILQNGSTGKSGFAEWWDTVVVFFTKNPMWLAAIPLALALILALVMWLRKRLAKRIPDPLKVLGADVGFQIAAGCIILLLLASDLFAMHNMFNGFRLKPEEAWIFSLTFAAFLEGFPFALGMIDPIKKDPAQFIMGRSKRYRVLSITCWTFLVISWILAIVIRLMFTEQPSMGGFLSFWEGEYNNKASSHSNNAYLAQVFLFVSPILTSILAYVLSYLAFGSSCLQQAAKLLRAAHARCSAAEYDYEECNHRRMDATTVLWSSLTGDADILPPVEFNDFRTQSMVFIREMQINGCLDAYPALLKRYNQEVENAISHYIAELSKYTTIPQVINQITVEQIVATYDAHMTRDVDKWDYELCEPAMCADLEQLLNDAVIGAQFEVLSN